MQTNTVAGRWGAVVLFLTLAVTLGFLVLASASPVDAAKGGQGKSQGGGGGKGHTTDTDTGSGGGGGGGNTSSASISVSPNPLIAYSSMTIHGTGFTPGEAVAIKIEQTWCCVWGSVVPDADGNFQSRGAHVFEHGGPVSQNEVPDEHAAMYHGWTDGREMRLTVLLLDTEEPIGTFSLTLDRTARLVKCL